MCLKFWGIKGRGSGTNMGCKTKLLFFFLTENQAYILRLNIQKQWSLLFFFLIILILFLYVPNSLHPVALL